MAVATAVRRLTTTAPRSPTYPQYPICLSRRETLLSMYAKIADGKRLDDLISLFLGSQEHPALRYACVTSFANPIL